MSKTEELPDATQDGTTIQRESYGPGTDGAEVVLVTFRGGGHTWPGREPAVKFLGKSTSKFPANDLMWKFSENHPRER